MPLLGGLKPAPSSSSLLLIFTINRDTLLFNKKKNTSFKRPPALTVTAAH
jgi:hypothetical protein